jgi:hypothetical protein
MKKPALLTLVTVSAAFAAPAFGQVQITDFQRVLSSADTPATLRLKELTNEWRRATITTADAPKGGAAGDMMSQIMQMGMMSEMGKGGGHGDAMGTMLGMSMLGGLMGGGQQPVYYTQGRVTTAGGEVFLVAYKYDKPQVNYMQLAMDAQASGKEPDPMKLLLAGKMTGDSTLSLALINVKTIGTVSGIRPFDMAQEIAESEKAGGGLMEMLMMSRSAPQAAPSTATVELPPAPATRATAPATIKKKKP